MKWPPFSNYGGAFPPLPQYEFRLEQVEMLRSNPGIISRPAFDGRSEALGLENRLPTWSLQHTGQFRKPAGSNIHQYHQLTEQLIRKDIPDLCTALGIP
jgi:hypothetical protein